MKMIMMVAVAVMIMERMFPKTVNIYMAISMFHYCFESFVDITLFNHKKSIWVDSIYTLITSIRKPKHRQGK